ncbi:MAG: ROK family protein [Chloroflexi bacterium]|nr:ROK family protein [Chloroflexota bacterium]
MGIDIGGSGIKGAPVDVDKGEFMAERERFDTPQPSTPAAVAEAVKALIKHFNWTGPIGCTFPAVVLHGVTLTAANVDQAWINTDAEALFRQATNCPVRVLNDADAAGIAEMTFGAGKDYKSGVVILLTFGTGIGSAIFTEGVLLPNTEFGHVELRGKDAEHRAAARVKTEKDLSWKQWGGRVNAYLQYMEKLFTPDLFIIGGGVSKKFEKFSPYLQTRAQIVPAQLQNDAGIVGAAMAAKVLV